MSTSRARLIDPRGPRLAASLTTLVLAIVVLTANAWLLAAQLAVFALGAVRGPSASPYGQLYTRVIRPRLDPPDHLEDPAPPRFAQAVGLALGAAGLVAYLAGAVIVGQVIIGAALAAAFLNAAFGLCLGCEVYLAYRRVFPFRSLPHTEVLHES